MQRPERGLLRSLGLTVLAVATWSATVSAQLPEDLDSLSGEQLYAAACASCHGPDGRGLERSLVGFEEQLPDFTDCDFAAREPDADWIAIAHSGGPTRGFSRMMPAFGEALTVDQIARIVRHIRGFCADPSWPPGELNLPRALLSEKAFPEDEWVVEGGASLEGEGAVDGRFVWEQRFGPRSQLEIAIPYGWAEVPTAGGSEWVSGFGDVILGVKHAPYQNGASGRIFAVGGELVLPTGDESKGLGADGAKTEGFASFGQVLPADAFLQAQVGAEMPFYTGGEKEGFGRVVLGRTFTSGRWGRSWTPMAELQAKRELEGGAPLAVDVVPQLQISLNARQHVLASLGVLIPATERTGRSVRLMAYVLLDWFDGGFFEGW